MDYLTLSDLQTRYPSDYGLFGDSQRVEQAIRDAVDEAEGYLASRYNLPLPAVPEVLKGKLADIARYRLWVDQASEEVRDRYRQAISWLKDVAAGRANLIFPADLATGRAPEPVVNRGRIAVGLAHNTGVFGDAVLSRMPSLPAGSGLVPDIVVDGNRRRQ